VESRDDIIEWWKNRPPQIETIVREVEVVKEIPVEVEVEKIVYRQHTGWREFENLAEFSDWVKDKLERLWVVGDKLADCDDFAIRLQREGYKDGYLISSQLVWNGKLFDKNVSNFKKPHMGNLIIIGNRIYFVEPQPDYFRIVFVANRD
jgi:hypothetical protein